MSLKITEAGPLHLGHLHRGEQTLEWYSTDSQENYKKNYSNPISRRKLENSGWTEDFSLIYRFNNQGFRADEFDDRPCAIALGCSHTFGVGLSENQTWSFFASDLLGLHVWNLGIAGASIDTNFRILDYYIGILKPKMVLHAVPSIYRFEYHAFDKFHNILIGAIYEDDLIHNGFFEDYFFHDINSELNARKNLLAMKYLCQRSNIPYYSMDVTKAMNMEDRSARDLEHPGERQQQVFAQKMIELVNNNPNGGHDEYTGIRCK